LLSARRKPGDILPAEPTQPLILVVEDDDAIRGIVNTVLQAEGYRTDVARNGVEGLDRFYMGLPDLIMMDVKMPEMDGWETLERLRRVSDCPVIMLTVFGSPDDIVRGLELGADDYLVKPFGVRELTAKVNAVLRRASLIS
jgi:DNA-binding response OmpR family regulator